MSQACQPRGFRPSLNMVGCWKCLSLGSWSWAFEGPLLLAKRYCSRTVLGPSAQAQLLKTAYLPRASVRVTKSPV